MSLTEHLAEKLGKSQLHIQMFAYGAPKYYKVYTIPKRSYGVRIIAHPSKQLKEYQREVVDYLSNKVNVHDAAHAYVCNRSIKTNALVHAKSKYILKMDFYAFFNSIKPDNFFSQLEKQNINLSDLDKRILRGLIFWAPRKKDLTKLVLSIGAPSSPLASNVFMYNFDSKVSKECKKLKVKYTRYADDITFSTNERYVLERVQGIVLRVLKKHYNDEIIINPTKTISTSKKHNRHITGVTLTNNGTLSLGRKKKKIIFSLVHNFLKDDNPCASDAAYIMGMISHANFIDDTFIQRLKKKYGDDCLTKLKIIAAREHNE